MIFYAKTAENCRNPAIAGQNKPKADQNRSETATIRQKRKKLVRFLEKLSENGPELTEKDRK